MAGTATHYSTTECQSDRLMSEANTQDGSLRRQLMQQGNRTSCIARPLRSRRNDHSIGRKTPTAPSVDLVTTNHTRLTTQTTQVASEVVDKRIVVIKKKDHD